MEVADLPVRGPFPRVVRTVDTAVGAAETADYRQAEYFLRLLLERRRLGDRRIEQGLKAIATCDADGDIEGAANFRRIVRIEERDRQVLDGMIENLRRRFMLAGRSGAPATARRAWVVAR